MGTLTSGTAAADEMAPYWNAAAMSLLRGTRVLIHGSLGATSVTYRRDTPSAFDGQMYPAANFTVASPNWSVGVVTDLGLERWRFGLSVGVPWADGAGWSATYKGRPASTRYHGLSPRIGQMLIGPAVAFRINRWLAIGAGVDITGVLLQHEYLVDFAPRVNQLICKQTGTGTSCPLNAPLVREDPLYAGRVEVDGLGWSAGAFGGVLFTPTSWLRLGLGVHSNAGRMRLPATMSVEVPPAVYEFTQRTLPGVTPSRLEAKGTFEYGTPIIVTAGAGFHLLGGRLDLGIDYHWMNMSTNTVSYGVVTETNTALIDDITSVRGRTDQFRLASWGRYGLFGGLSAVWRLEYVNNTRPEAFISPNSIDVHRVEASLGVVWQLESWLALIVEYSHYFTWDREVNVSRFGPKAFPVTKEEQGFDNTSPTGVYEVSGDRGALGLRFSF